MTQHNDIVNHPAHYTSCKSGIECIEIAELLPFCLGNCYKYLHRAGLKGDKLTDLKKSLWYARRAYLNDEKLPEKARVRILEVATHQDSQKRDILTQLAQKPIGAFYIYLKSYVSKYEHQ
ncbi:hypothetical protein AAX05_03415 [Moraxella bovoculi]|uniref:DUF3310 domain-containing protein n=1 Tax=Moraxella bovoculi TaxID=386891 RepID=A0AAC8T8W0_9GAMM|nr:DUF3310 domain-containing protein [Moraxella bovoculi]AKG08403.1 hypothetical protein AAX06_09920 [Moraxella bovoculi]AKG09379.1 hypothetical protein AAX05_03415 [Moraxella bovoculi]AKG12264.1 hypothetical protein AAX07_10155 [Moraxella bovoculi]AKG13205.1 hypothetical protein AAX11_03165 [Moraxella bovoculi]AKG14235.1 hypothetical protein AAX11_09690 [Moraxella bovoculi]